MLETALLATAILGVLKFIGVDMPWYAWTAPLLVVLIPVVLWSLFVSLKERA